MRAQSKLLFLVLLCVVVAGVGAVLLRRAPSTHVELVTGTAVDPGRALADFSLLDHQGRRFGPANLHGHWSLMFFGYSNCPAFCPATLATLAALQKRLRADQAIQPPQVIFVSVDAKRDTPAQLAKFVPNFDPEFIGLTAPDQSAIEAIAKTWGIAVTIHPERDGNYTVDHTSAIFVLDPAGKLVAVLTGPFTVDALQGDFRRIVAGRA
jgi:protein SCO1/2